MRAVRLLSLLTDSIYVLLAFYFLYLYTRSILNASPWLQTGFLWIFQFSVLILFVIRRRASDRSTSILDYLYTFAAFGSVMLFRTTSGSAVVPSIVAEAIEFAGAVVVLGALSSLNRSFGVAPENRGIKTRGLYRVVRHPMYLGYALIYSGFVLGNVSWFNAFVLSATTLFLLMRLQAEERLLREDARYRTYAEETRWKLVPYVF